MCGRTACTLTPDELCKACSYKLKTNKYKQVEWQDFGCNFQYAPSYNMCPAQATPVLVLRKCFDPNSTDPRDKLIVPMIWGFIPPYHKGSYTSHGLSTNNCRSEKMLVSPLYSGPLKHGQRCVALCDGFYEWQNMAGYKQPYLIYLPQPEGVRWDDRSTWNLSWSEEKGYHGPRPVPMAGIFGVWISPWGEKILNYTVVTMESSNPVDEIHDRMPLILDSDEKIDRWLNAESEAEILSLVKPPVKLEVYPVTRLVGNAHFNEHSCVVPIDLKSPKQDGSSKLMSTWLSKGNPPQESPVKCEVPAQSVSNAAVSCGNPKQIVGQQAGGMMASWLNSAGNVKKSPEKNLEADAVKVECEGVKTFKSEGTEQ